MRLSILIVSVSMLVLASMNAQIATNTKGGKATYGVAALNNEQSERLIEAIKGNENMYKILEAASFRLDFNNEQASFYLEDNNRLSESQLRKLETFVSVNREYAWWQNNDSAFHVFISKPPLKPDTCLIAYDFKAGEDHTEWIITTESKQIGEYTCFKATRNDIRVAPSSGQQFTFPIIAWFCPELPYPYGPTKYGGLPGLIMELQTERLLFGLRKLEFGEDVIIPSLPPYEKITETEQTQRILKELKRF